MLLTTGPRATLFEKRRERLVHAVSFVDSLDRNRRIALRERFSRELLTDAAIETIEEGLVKRADLSKIRRALGSKISRDEAANVLRIVKDENAISPLVAALIRERDPATRNDITDALIHCATTSDKAKTDATLQLANILGNFRAWKFDRAWINYAEHAMIEIAGNMTFRQIVPSFENVHKGFVKSEFRLFMINALSFLGFLGTLAFGSEYYGILGKITGLSFGLLYIVVRIKIMAVEKLKDILTKELETAKVVQINEPNPAL
ncbi:MAG: hypothetical protein Q7S22_05855 [Candidatus Micrarchaeota archaeon]|nr:hypothetical protein [Candidatus Micrarchaeota archaeon]